MSKALPSQQRLHELFYCVGGRLIHKGKRQGRGYSQYAGNLNNRGRYQTQVDGERYTNARLVYMWYHGVDPAEYEVDHVNNNHSDDSGFNLQLLAADPNNRKRAARELPTGVYRRGERYRAEWCAGGKRFRSPTVDTIEEARAYYLQGIA